MKARRESSEPSYLMDYSDWYCFSAGREEFGSLIDFGYACAYWQYRDDIAFLTESAKRNGFSLEHTQPWEKRREEFDPQSISAHIFSEKVAYHFEAYLPMLPAMPEEDVQSAMIMLEEWDSTLIVAQFAERYVGGWWITEA
mgnify:CR=1 FL=1